MFTLDDNPYKRFHENPTGKSVGSLGCSDSSFCLNLSNHVIFTLAPGRLQGVDFNSIPFVAYTCTRIAFRSSREHVFFCASFDLDKVNEDNIYTMIMNNHYQNHLKNSKAFFDNNFAINRRVDFTIVLHRSGSPLDYNEVSRFILRSDELVLSLDGIAARLVDGVASMNVRCQSRSFPERMFDDKGKFFLMFNLVDEDAEYRLIGSGFKDPVYKVTKCYFGDGLFKYLSAIQDVVVTDLSILADPNFYRDGKNVEKYLQVVGKRNFIDAEKIVDAVACAYGPNKILNILVRGEGFGFLTYHFARRMPNVKVFSYEPSFEMRRVASEMGIFVGDMLTIATYDFEIMMNVSNFIEPFIDSVIAYDSDHYFPGSNGFTSCGGLLFVVLHHFLITLSFLRKSFLMVPLPIVVIYRLSRGLSLSGQLIL